MMTKPLVRLVTAAHLPDLAPDDQELLHALQRQGVPVDIAVWDDPSVDWSEARLTVIRSIFDYYLKYDKFLSWLNAAESETAIRNHPETIKWNSHKSYLKDLEHDGLPVIPTEWIEKGASADLKEIQSRLGWSEMIVKPAVSASAHRALKVTSDNISEGQSHVDDLLRDVDALVQPYLYDFETTGETSVIWLGPTQTHCVRRPSGIHTSLEEAHVGASLEPNQSELDLASRAYSRITPQPLYGRIDVVDSQEFGPLILELELIEPALYLRHAKAYAERFAEAIAEGLESRQ